MKQNLGLIIDSLDPAFYACVTGNLNSMPNLTGICPLVPGLCGSSPDVLYLVTWEQLQKADPPPKYVACIGGGEDSYAFLTDRKITGVIFSGDKDPFYVLLKIQAVFNKYNDLERELFSLLLADAPIKSILNLCSHFFKGHIMLFSSEFHLIDYSDEYLPSDDNGIWKETVAQRRSVLPMLPRERVKMLPNRPNDFPNSTFLEEAVEGMPPHFNFAFDEGDNRFATLIVMEIEKKFSEYLHWLVDCIAEIIHPKITERYSTSMNARNNFRKSVYALLRNRTSDILLIENDLDKLGWQQGDEYQILLVSLPSESTNISHYLYNYENVFANAYADSIALHFEDFILVLLHDSACKCLNEFLLTLEKQLEMDNGICSVGIRFCELSQLKTQYSLTILPFRHYPNTNRIRYYSQLLPIHIINEINSFFPLRSVCHCSAVRIYEHDIANGTNYLSTLETYLMNNKSLIAAANSLFIHKSTMTYRLKCIEKITDMALDDPDERLRILLSCIVLRILK